MIAWKAHGGTIESMAFSADGRVLATATGGTRTVHLSDPTTGALARKLTGDWPDGRGLHSVKAVAFAPHAPLLAAGSARSVAVWNTDTWEPVADLGSALAYELAFGPGERPALAASDSMGTAVYADAGRPTGSAPRPSDHLLGMPIGVAALDFSPDGRLVAANNCHAAGVWNPATGERLKWLKRPAGNHRGAVRFSPDGAVLALARGKFVDLWAIELKVGVSARLTATLTAGTGRQPAVWALGWSADSRVLMTAGADGFVRFWDAAAGREIRSFAWGLGKVYCAAFSPDGLTCAAGGESGQVVVWDVDA
ncbi:WD40 repeat domain-containing protein [Gemmata sp.]|uniref:WD40 repeat domain-containing protein n=1 Tax=Gemmata sp. TaxID=1914242 RepID=UPI003F7226CC